MSAVSSYHRNISGTFNNFSVKITVTASTYSKSTYFTVYHFLSLPFVRTLVISVMNLDDLTRRGLYLSDIPLHDATRDLVLLGEQFREEYKLTQELEILTDRLQHTLRALEDEKKKTDRFEYFYKFSFPFSF